MSKENIATLIAQIESENKAQFLAILHQLIENDIASRSSTECLQLKSTAPDGHTRSWSFSDGVGYISRLFAFIRNQPFAEYGVPYALDSALTPHILDIVSTAVTELIASYDNEIADVVVSEALINKHVRDAFLDTILQDKLTQVAGAKVKSALAAHLMAGVQSRLHDLGVHAVAGAGAVIAKVASLSVGPLILSKLAVAIAHNVGPLIAKLLAKPAFALAMKKFAGAAIISAVMKFVAGHAGGAAVTTVILPVIAGWLICDYAAFPRNLGKSVADALCSNLDKSFRSTITEIATNLVAEFSQGASLRELASKLAKDPEVRKAIDKVVAENR